MSDPFGSVYPVVKEFGCRNTVYDEKKIFLADKPEAYEALGLWGARLMFTTESAKECADIALRYRDENRYCPNNTSRGLYPKGAL
jgi:putative protease